MLNEVVNHFDEGLKEIISGIDSVILEKITEIRIRKNRPVIIVIRNSSYFIDYNSDIYDYECHNAVTIDADSFDKLFLSFCDYSVYSSMETLKKGFVTLKNGARIGIAGTGVYDDKGLISVKDISSLNIRIPRQVIGCSDKILNFLYVNSFPSIIIAGKPNSGKTTLLRDIAYQLSNGFNNRYSKITVVDERNEITGKAGNTYSMNIGANCDVLSGFSKASAIEIATRVLSPDIIICDEIATLDEVESINYAFSSGIAFALSVHISSYEELATKPVIRRLIESREFKYVVMLDNHSYNAEIIELSEVENEINRILAGDGIINGNRCDILKEA